MASIWLQYTNGAKYITCSNIVEAYYNAKKLCLYPKSFCLIHSEFTTKPFYILQNQPIYVAIYFGTFTPPIHFNYEITKITLSDFMNDSYYQEEIKKIKNVKEMEFNMRKYIKENMVCTDKKDKYLLL